MIDLHALYRILADVARSRGQLTYTDLSNRYLGFTGEWHEPHGTWDEPLGELNRSLNELGWAPLSAVVVLQETREPGGLFWGSSPNIPERPKDEISRIARYSQILAAVHAASWPGEIPTLRPQ